LPPVARLLHDRLVNRSQFFAAVVVVAACGVVARSQPATPVEPLEVGRDTDRSIAERDIHDWPVDLEAGEYAEIVVAPRGVELAATVLGPSGASVREIDGLNIAFGVDGEDRTVVSFVASGAGRYRLRLKPVGPSVSSARYRLRLEARRPAQDADRLRMTAHTLWREGMKLFANGTADAKRTAVAKYEEARQLLSQAGDRDGEALTLSTIAGIWYSLSDATQAAAAGEQALAIWKGIGRDRETAVAQSDLGLIAYLAYDHATARQRYADALATHRALGDTLSEARTLTRLGWVQYAAGQLTNVVDLNHQALALWRAAGDSGGESVSHNDLGRAYLDLGEMSEALDAFEHALALRPEDVSPGSAGSVLTRIGILYLNVSEWQRGLDALHRALVLTRRAKDRRSEAAVLTNLASGYIRVGDTREAAGYLNEALAVAREVGFRTAEANVLLQLGIAANMNADRQQSREYFQQALSVFRATNDVRGQVLALRQLASVQVASGVPNEALQSITESLEKMRATPGTGMYSGAITLANVYDALGDTEKARAQYQQAIDSARQYRAREHEAAGLATFGRFLAKHGQYEDARESLQQGLAIYESLRSSIVDPDLRMSYTSKALTPYKVSIDVLMEMDKRSPGRGFAAEALLTNERAHARGLLDLLATSGVDIHQGVDPALVARERTLRWNLNAKAALLTSQLTGRRDPGRLASLEKQIEDLSVELRDTTTRIRQESPGYAALVAPQPLTAAQLQVLLDPDTVLLEYALGEAKSWMFALTDAGLETFELPSRERIEDLARSLYRQLTARQPVAGESAADRRLRVARADAVLVDGNRALSDAVLGPVAERLAKQWRDRRLVFVADGALAYVPFGVLPVPGSSPAARESAPLVAAHEVVTLPSASVVPLLRSVDRGRRASKTIAVLADPVFTRDDPRVRRSTAAQRPPSSASAPAPDSVATRAFDALSASTGGGALTRLPFSRSEALAVAALAPSTSVLQATDFNASLGLATSGRLAEYRILHFATHGLINSTQPELSGLALSLVDADGRSQDGFLRLNTIYNMRLAADLVVLSACQSALGKEISGEGLVGLTRGFMYAGARRVIASLWQVDDVATAELMKRFYRGLLNEQLTPAAALRAAQQELRKQPQWSSPFFWAAFVVEGDWK
jgi:CHAT domain-containing protein/tetratricopeptide (TPR) repeat protein